MSWSSLDTDHFYALRSRGEHISTSSCNQTFSPWSDLAFLRAGVPLVQVSRHVVVSTDASAMGWGAMCNGHAAAGLWTGPQLQWHINCLAVWLALRRFKSLLHDKQVLVCTDNTVTIAYSRRMLHVATRPPSPPLESEASGVASHHSCPRRAQSCSQWALTSARPSGRMATPPRDSPADLEMLQGRSGRPVCLPGHVPLPAVLLPVWGDPRHGRTGTQLRKYAFPPVSLLAQTLCKVREDEEQVLLVAPYWPNRAWFPEMMLHATAPP